MILQLQRLALLGAILALSLPNLCLADTPDIPADTPISSLIASAKAARARGSNNDALAYFDAAVNRDPSDYLTLFQRGATYLSLGRNSQASADFDAVLRLRPGFEGALLQRGKIKARSADWTSAKQDYSAAGAKGAQDLAELEEAAGAAKLAEDAEKSQDWEGCVSNAGVAIMVASTSLSLRQLRARCRFERGEIQEGVNDLAHVLQIQSGLVEPHLQMSSMLFYGLGDTDRGLAQIKKCLHSDPDSKPCKTLFREEKAVMKSIKEVRALMDSRQFNSAAKLLVGTGAEDEQGLLQELKDNTAAARSSNMMHLKAPSKLYNDHVEMTCECYMSMKNSKKAAPYCKEALEVNPDSLHGLLHSAQTLVDAESYDQAIHTLNKAKDAHPDAASQINEKINEAQTLLRRSKQKDYYKILGVSKDADERTIKRAYRKATKEFHPDKAMARGVPKEEAEKKMAGMNEAYEVLTDPELKARFDRGEDPMNPEARQGGNPFHGSPFGPGGGGQQFVFQQGGQGQKIKFNFPGGGGGGGGNPFGGFPFGM